jgi:hypothetical protein
MKCLAKAFTVVGLAGISVWSYLATGGEAGSGWAILSVLVLFFASCEDSK